MLNVIICLNENLFELFCLYLTIEIHPIKYKIDSIKNNELKSNNHLLNKNIINL